MNDIPAETRRALKLRIARLQARMAELRPQLEALEIASIDQWLYLYRQQEDLRRRLGDFCSLKGDLRFSCPRPGVVQAC